MTATTIREATGVGNDREARMARLRERLGSSTDGELNLRVMLVLAHEALRQQGIAESAPRLEYSPAPAIAATAPPAGDYGQLVAGIHGIVARTVARGARLLVISRGDDALFAPGFVSAHFPQAAGGAYAGHYPADGASAIAHLEDCIAGGAEFLVIPATSFWWLDHYEGLAHHLLTRSHVVHHDEQCLVFSLRSEPQGAAT
jgi:hypothetical protein